MKENLFLLKDLLKHLGKKSINITVLLQNLYIDKLAGIVNNYNNTYHSTINMKPVDIKSSTYIDSDIKK